MSLSTVRIRAFYEGYVMAATGATHSTRLTSSDGHADRSSRVLGRGIFAATRLDLHLITLVVLLLLFYSLVAG
jgi:hypothetical protein